MADVFQAAAFRFGHTQIPAGIYLRDDKCNFDQHPAFRLCNTWFDSQETLREVGGIEPLIMGLASQIAEKEDAIIIDDLRGKKQPRELGINGAQCLGLFYFCPIFNLVSFRGFFNQFNLYQV